MGTFEVKYWNLSQAAAWVVYRRRDLVEEFADPPQGFPEAFKALTFYPTSARPKRVGSLLELEEALRNGRVRAMGRRSTGSSEHVEIPDSEWRDLSIRPPRVVRNRYPVGPTEPWRDIIFESAELKKLWRSENEVAGRSKYDWQAIHAIYEELRGKNPKVSQNELILDTQETYRERLNREPPARSTIIERIKRWNG